MRTSVTVLVPRPLALAVRASSSMLHSGICARYNQVSSMRAARRSPVFTTLVAPRFGIPMVFDHIACASLRTVQAVFGSPWIPACGSSRREDSP